MTSSASGGSLNTTAASQLPSWLSRHFNLGFNDDDVSALIDSIDASQNPPASVANLPAELLLHVLEYVPVDYILDWRLVCRGFRDAIDGRTLYHHLRRTQLIGFVGPRTHWPLRNLTDEQYDRMQFLHATFDHVEDSSSSAYAKRESRPIWGSTHAVFNIDMSEFVAGSDTEGAGSKYDSTIEYADTIWRNAASRLELTGAEEGFGTLRWCIKVDRTVIDLDLPLEAGRHSFEVTVDMNKGTVKVAWKDMLFRFLKTEAALRRMLDQRRSGRFTFNHAEDCLREVRRQRLHASLDPDNKVDRHLKWSLRLLRPLFGKPYQDHAPLQAAENIAIDALLFLRRQAAMSTDEIARMYQLSEDLKTMDTEWKDLEREFDEFRAHMFPGFAYNIPVSTSQEEQVPYNPIAWPDELRAQIHERVNKWRSQKKVMAQMCALLASSNQVLSVSEDSFDDLSSDI
ncbi:hypothetical protein HBI49_077880 [Parastagonospora nodorum]|nr:hypothetical protein HBH51_092010 [Parastagonospora nodorum]KAH5307344.1 hypothetical protein HBI12_163520 [Parastagonospora nodorum]KAH5370472.1 hypothetical protein HBI49_077880 [Parastagonospora nodorum]KAH5382416.1 hypothetical protein HBI33_132870 [Parastagonospora nodorum]KAH5541080.1 hypothetical protein HBI27_091440 [Parastagonospora nodorum]